MTIAEQFIKNLKALADKKVFTEEEVSIILLSLQETATLSPLELISLLDNVDVCFEEALKEMPQDEFDALKKELLEE